MCRLIISPIYLHFNSVTASLLVYLLDRFIESVDNGYTDVGLGPDIFGGGIDGFSISLLGGAGVILDFCAKGGQFSKVLPSCGAHEGMHFGLFDHLKVRFS